MHVGAIPTQCPHCVTKQDNTVQYNGKLTPSNQHADVDMRSGDAQKTEPSEIVSACVTENRRGQTSAPQSEPITGRGLQTHPNLGCGPCKSMLMSTHFAPRTHNPVMAECSSCSVCISGALASQPFIFRVLYTPSRPCVSPWL